MCFSKPKAPPQRLVMDTPPVEETLIDDEPDVDDEKTRRIGIQRLMIPLGGGGSSGLNIPGGAGD